jgi:hypothetical protein
MMEKAKIEVTTNGAQTNVITRGEGGRVVGFVGGAPLALAADIASIASAHEGGASVTVEGVGTRRRSSRS